MNKMKEVAQLLGVELDEEFYIKTLGSKYRITSNGLETENSITRGWDISLNHFFRDLLTGKLEIKKPILDKVEKEYLENVIRPFRDTVECITKTIRYSYDCSLRKEEKSECIGMSIKDKYDVYLPPFKLGSMYKGMEINKLYTLKELGLFEGRLEKESEEK